MAIQAAGPETQDPVATNYFVWSPEGSGFTVEVHPDVMDGIGRDVNANSGMETGGLLLGSVLPQESGDMRIRIERFHRIARIQTDPEFVLDAADRDRLEKTAASILSAGEFSAVGLYRSHLRAGLQLETGDFDLIERYFQEPSDLALLVKPDGAGQMSARFFVHRDGGTMDPLGDAFPYNPDRGRVFSPPTVRPRRLIADFVLDTVQPSRYHEPEEASGPARWMKWWPVPASLLVAGLALWLLLSPSRKSDAPPSSQAAAAKAEPLRPLDLNAAAAGQTWRISWNPGATALRGASSVKLSVIENDTQKPIELSAEDLSSGTAEYKSAANEIRFRLEVADKAGAVSTDTVRFVREAPVPAAPPAPPAHPEPPAHEVTPPKATHKVPPSIPDSIRPRIKGAVVIEVHVKIDATGRVTSAAPVGKHRAGIDTYLAGRAVEAAKAWRFDPARENGKPVPGEQTIRFPFGK